MSAFALLAGYRPGLIGRCLELQARYYARHAGFGAYFETGRARDIAEFFGRTPDARSEIWSAMDGDTIVGTVAIDGADLGFPIAHLRWFIVDDGARGHGLGRRLLATALDFADTAGFAETHLWTFAGLDAARKLYDASGFGLRSEEPTQKWGPEVREQFFVRVAPWGGTRLQAM